LNWKPSARRAITVFFTAADSSGIRSTLLVSGFASLLASVSTYDCGTMLALSR